MTIIWNSTINNSCKVILFDRIGRGSSVKRQNISGKKLKMECELRKYALKIIYLSH